MNIKVISSDLDGAQLRREKMASPRYICCKGKRDNEEINEALTSSSKGKQFNIPSSIWERIFGGK